MRLLVMLDGTIGDPDSAVLRVDDLGLMRGDGVFETVLVDRGRPRELGPHLDRLARSAAMLDLPSPDRAGWERCVETVLREWSGGDEFALKLVYTRGVEGSGVPTGFALAAPVGERIVKLRSAGVSAVTLDRGIDPAVVDRAPWLLLGAKSLSYAVNMAAVREAERRGADEVVFFDPDNAVLEGPTSSVVLVQGRTLRTPPVQLGILAGTTQAALFRAAERAGFAVKVEPLSVDELYTADCLLLVSSVRKITRIHTLNDRPIADNGGLRAELAALYESEYA